MGEGKKKSISLKKNITIWGVHNPYTVQVPFLAIALAATPFFSLCATPCTITQFLKSRKAI